MDGLSGPSCQGVWTQLIPQASWLPRHGHRLVVLSAMKFMISVLWDSESTDSWEHLLPKQNANNACEPTAAQLLLYVAEMAEHHTLIDGHCDLGIG